MGRLSNYNIHTYIHTRHEPQHTHSLYTADGSTPTTFKESIQVINCMNNFILQQHQVVTTPISESRYLQLLFPGALWQGALYSHVNFVRAFRFRVIKQGERIEHGFGV